MCRAEGMALAPWGVMGSGNLKTEEQWNDPNKRMSAQPNDVNRKVNKVLESIGKRRETEMSSIAMAYVMHKAPYVFPVLGTRKVEQMEQNIKALDICLSKKELAEIDDATDFDRGWPHSWLAPQVKRDEIQMPNDCWPLNFAWVDVVPRQDAIPGGRHGAWWREAES